MNDIISNSVSLELEFDAMDVFRSNGSNPQLNLFTVKKRIHCRKTILNLMGPLQNQNPPKILIESLLCTIILCSRKSEIIDTRPIMHIADITNTYHKRMVR